MKTEGIDRGQAFDFGRTSALYAAFRDIYPPALYDRLRALGVAAPGTAWLDLGTGTGVLPKNLYREDVRIVGADLSAEQIAYAKREAEAAGRRIEWLVAPAEETGLPDRSFDAVTAAQCFFYFDRAKMQTELRRLIRPGGVFVKIFMDWATADPVADASAALVRRLNPSWTSGARARQDMEDPLFPGRQTACFSAALPFTRESWHGRMTACRGTLASMDEDTFRRWETAHRELLAAFPARFTVEHRVMLTWFRFE